MLAVVNSVGLVVPVEAEAKDWGHDRIVRLDGHQGYHLGWKVGGC